MPQGISRHKSDTKCIVALGSNVDSPAGPPLETVVAGVRALAGERVRLIAGSRLFATPCFPAGAGQAYVNAAVSLATDLSPEELLRYLHAIEQRFERRRDVRWGSRTLDLDLIDHGGKILPTPDTWDDWYRMPAETQLIRAPDQLILPHPRLQDRGFVLVPVTDIAPGWCHPVLQRTARDLCAALPPEALAGIEPLDSGETLALCVEGG